MGCGVEEDGCGGDDYGVVMRGDEGDEGCCVYRGVVSGEKMVVVTCGVVEGYGGDSGDGGCGSSGEGSKRSGDGREEGMWCVMACMKWTREDSKRTMILLQCNK